MFGLRFTPDDYAKEPELWLANALSHVGLGVWLAIASCGMWLYASGEFPEREAIGVLLVVFYLSYELSRQGWRGFDTVEDALFVAGYGGCGALYCFIEVSPGSDQITAGLFDLIFVSTFPLVHMVAGASIRIARRKKCEGISADA